MFTLIEEKVYSFKKHNICSTVWEPLDYNERVIVSSVSPASLIRAPLIRECRVSVSDIRLIRKRSCADKPRFRLILALLPDREIPRGETMRALMYI